MTRPPDARAGRGGPPLLAPALAWAVLTLAAAAAYPGTRAGADPSTTLDLLRAHAVSGPCAAVALLASAVPFAVWVGAVHHRLTRLGLRVAGPTLGLAGGLLAAAALAASAVSGWSAVSVATLPDPSGDAAASVVSGLTGLAFATGGAMFAVMFGLLMAGTSVPMLIVRLVPLPLAVAGLVLAGVSVVALLSLIVPALGVLLPVVRFGGLVWLVWVSAVLPVTRRRVAGDPAPDGAVAAGGRR